MTDRAGKLVVVRGAGEMATGVIRRLAVSGFRVVTLEQAKPDCIRRTICFAEAVYERQWTVEGITAIAVDSVDDARDCLDTDRLPILTDPEARLLSEFRPSAVIDARMYKKQSDCRIDMAPVVIGVGPGFIAGKDCHAVIESNRGYDLGRAVYEGSVSAYTGKPAPVEGYSYDRLVVAPADGTIRTSAEIGDMVKSGESVGVVGELPVTVRLDGVLRGLIRDGLQVVEGQKIGDVDPRGNRDYCFRISEKANAIAGGVLEALLFLLPRV